MLSRSEAVAGASTVGVKEPTILGWLSWSILV